MMDTLRIVNFKCFNHFDAKLNQLTVLTGANGSGKSSIVQSILLFRSIMEETKAREGSYRVALNGYHSLAPGTFDDICRFGADSISFTLDDNASVTLTHLDDEDENPAVSYLEGKASAKVEIADPAALPEWVTSGELYYLNAERLGPRWESDINKHVTSNAGDHGEYAGNMLLGASYSYPGVPPEKRFSEDTPDNFNIQVDFWMSHICSEVAFKAEPRTAEKCQVKLRQNRQTLATPNTGFGYTYALPIVLDGLMAPRGSMLVVENPEAHLHPKAQSNIGFFLGKMAAAGVKIVVETHSEHVVNGIRRAALSHLGLSTDDITIYFCDESRPDENPEEITVDSKGNLSDFPVDFFDQVRQDMLEIIRLASQD